MTLTFTIVVTARLIHFLATTLCLEDFRIAVTLKDETVNLISAHDTGRKFSISKICFKM